jgi:hypothetical protein
MTPTKKIPVRCAILGMDARTAYSYEYCIRNYADGAFALAGSEQDAQILLIDVDSAEGRRIAQQQLSGQAAGKVAVIVSANLSHPDKVLFLHKPGRADSLRQVLNQAAAQLQGSAPAPRAAAPAAEPALGYADSGVAGAALAMEDDAFNHYMFRFDRHDGGDTREMFFDPQLHLYGAVRNARQLAEQEGRMVELRSDLPPIRVCPRTQRVHVGMRDQVLRSVAVTHVRPQLVVLPESDSRWPADAHTEPVDALLWRLAAWTSRGRLPQGTDPAAPVRLRHWPNMTRLIPTPHAMQIAALWSSGAHTLADTSRQLMTSLGDVHVFYCAVDALGLVETVRTGSPVPVPVQGADGAPAAATRGGLLSRILARLIPGQKAAEFP